MKKLIYIGLLLLGEAALAQVGGNQLSTGQNYQPGVVPYSSAQASQGAWQGRNRYGGPYGVNNPYSPVSGYGSGSFNNSNYMSYGGYGGGYGAGGMGMQNNPTMMLLGATTGLGGTAGATASAGGLQTQGPLNLILDLFYGEGDFSSRLIGFTLRAAVLQALGGGDAFKMLMYQNYSYRPPATKGSAAQSANKKSIQAAQNSKLNPCDRTKLLGPTQSVNDLNKQLLEVLY